VIRYLLTGIAVLLLSSASAWADTEAEISYLLSYIEHSGCTFERNGDVHDARKAREHIQRKYDYVKRWAGDRVETAEDFIEVAATRSSMSGRLYTVRCDEQVIPSGEWLHSALADYRSNTAPAPAPTR
jgi:hypothetical protein